MIWDSAVSPASSPGVALEGVGRPWCWQDGAAARFYSPERRIAVHTARDARLGRPTEGAGAVFQYDALAPGQRFAGAILVGTIDDGEALKDLLTSSPLRLGGSRSAGYGQVRVVATAVVAGWQETAAPHDLAPDDRLLLTCISPCLVRDGQGRFAADLRIEELAAILGHLHRRVAGRPGAHRAGT